MRRNFTVEAVILAHRRTAGQHRQVVLLSPEIGMIDAAAYGAKKGSLTGKVGQFLSGIGVLYHDPAKQFWKITDFTPKQYRSYLTTSLPLIYSASFFSECIMRTHVGGGEHEQLYELVNSAFDALEDDSLREKTVIQFLWRYLQTAGFLADADHCASCGMLLERSDVLSLDEVQAAFVCRRCFAPGVSELELSAGGRAYLSHTARLSFNRALQVNLSRDAFSQLKQLLLRLADLITEGSLRTLRSGMI